MQLVKFRAQMGFSKSAAITALKNCNNVLKAAVKQLSGKSAPPLRQGHEGQSDTINTSNNFFYNLLFYPRDRLQSCTNYCLTCYEKHPRDSFRLRACRKEICEFRLKKSPDCLSTQNY